MSELSEIGGLWWVNLVLDNLTEGRYPLPISSEEANEGTATGGGGPRPFYVTSEVMEKRS
jgi:hypothetical protein